MATARSAGSADEARRTSSVDSIESVDVVVVGAGFSGMYALYRLRELGLSVRVFETGDGVGGTWYWNRYPGARVDVPSLYYSYSFSSELQQEWSWPETYSAQPDLLRYAESVADRFDLRRDMAFETTVVGAVWDDRAARWTVVTDRGDRVSARYLIGAAGCLSATNLPTSPGSSRSGKVVPHVALAEGGGRPRRNACRRRRYGVFGHPSHSCHRRAGVPPLCLPTHPQLQLPVQPQADGPRRGAGVEGALRRAPGQGPRLLRRAACRGAGPLGLDVGDEERTRRYEALWKQGAFGVLQSFNDLRTSLEANDTLAEFVRGQIRRIVRDPEVAERLCPKDHPVGTKRPCLDVGYYETFNRDNVTLVDVRADPIEEITATGLRTTRESYDLDVIVFATGFDAMTGPLLRMGISGRNGLTLSRSGRPVRARTWVWRPPTSPTSSWSPDRGARRCWPA